MLTLADLSAAIEETCAQLEELVAQITEAGDRAAHTEAAFKTAFAKARLLARSDAEREGRKITTDEAEDRATAYTDRLPYLLAANNLTVLREALRARQSRLDALRTLCASHRSAGG